MRIPVLLFALGLYSSIHAQTTLFSETFESSPTITLNTTDQGGVSNSPDNTWLINNAYTGGGGTVVCIGFPFPFSVPNTPAQPGGVTSPNGNYLHITSVAAQNSGILNSCFLAADGLCANAASHFARMSTDVATGPEDITLSFWWLCSGGTANYGEVYYSTNSGTSWTQLTTPISQYRNQGNWVQQSITLPAFSNQATLRFGFRFFNGTTTSAQDPAFSVDDIRIVSATAVPNSITTGTIASTTYCQGAQLSVPYTAVGAYTGGNIFSAELSDASGSFAAPVVIGTLASTVSGSISCTIPALTPVGTGYRIRVVSNMPSTTGSVNASDISINSAPYAGADDAITLCKNSGLYDLIIFLDGASNCGTWTGPGGGAFSGTLNTSADNAGAYTYTTNCPGGCPQDAATLTITLQDPASAGNDVSASLCSTGAAVSLFSYVNGGDLTGIFFYNGQGTNGSFLNTPGVYDLVYVVYGSAPCANDTAEFTFTVNAAPQAGTSTTVTVCQNAAPFALLPLLGNAQAGGTWTGPGGPSNGIVEPAIGPAGLYTYTVVGLAPCANAQAFVAVVIDPCQGIGDIGNVDHGMHWIGQEGVDHVIRIDQRIAANLELLDVHGRVLHTYDGPFEAGVVRVPITAAAGIYLLRPTGQAAALQLLHR
ncbi:MAG: hypothetical protein IT226_05195 [Flavobacteriales bacterium]|nr:hypothetical protein [Flavobacteriales bacterium]